MEAPPRSRRPPGWLLGCLAVALLGLAVFLELRTSRLQAAILSRITGAMSHWVEPGPSDAIRYPVQGPYDRRLGYVALPGFIDRLTAQGYTVTAQARQSPRLLTLTDLGAFTLYREKTQAGLAILDDGSRLLFRNVYPERVYPSFDDVPELVVRTLLFIENRELLENVHPCRNPAIEWDRLGQAVLSFATRLIGRDRSPGGSTLATQMEKFRHSADGVTLSVGEKMRQMVTASLRAYMDGEETLPARRRIVLDYLNSMPLAAAPGVGEVTGLGDGLWTWYGADFHRINRVLSTRVGKADGQVRIEEWALAYRQVLSLLLAQRRPSSYLIKEPGELADRADTYLRLLGQAGVITPAQQKAALWARVEPGRVRPPQAEVSYVRRKAVNSVRAYLFSLLGLTQYYDLDKLDLTVQTTLDSATQAGVTRILSELREPDRIAAAGLRDVHLLDRGDPRRLIYSFVLFEHRGGANLLRVHADNYNQPFDIGASSKLELGSTAKLRVLVTYLEIVADLQEQYGQLSTAQLDSLSFTQIDHLTRWAIGYLRNNGDHSLRAMLDAAMKRSYSASPAERFVTGGGLHQFANFNPEDDGRVLSIRQALRNSVNLPFIRLMSDVVDYHNRQRNGVVDDVSKLSDSKRRSYLERFADREGSTFVSNFYRRYQGRKPDEALELLAGSVRQTLSRLASLHRYALPAASVDEFGAFLRQHLPQSDLSDATVRRVYDEYAPGAYSLTDRGYILGIHPLELWTVAYLCAKPNATRQEAIQASSAERIAVYDWLLNSNKRSGQDQRIRALMEVEAFQDVHAQWERVGYPFESLVPSLATAIGSSGDRPVALAELVGIVLNNGVRYPSVHVQELHFGEATPFETQFQRAIGQGEQVMRPEVAATVRQELMGVVDEGTAVRIRGVFKTRDGRVLAVGGKTGTGDNRSEVYGAGARLISSTVTNRTATFVFYVGDRFFGVITAYVQGEEAEGYGFTSSLPVQVLKVLAPCLEPLIQRSPGAPLAAMGTAPKP